MKQLDFFKQEQEEPCDSSGHTKHCSRCKKDLPITEFGKLHQTGSGKQFYQANCKPCRSERESNTYYIKKTAPPTPTHCECCGVSFENVVKKNIHMDHCDETLTFRGWLCQRCNVGLGYLGDDLEGVQKALDYLMRHHDLLKRK